MQKMYKMSSLIILKMSIGGRSLQIVSWTTANAPWTTLSEDFYELIFQFLKL